MMAEGVQYTIVKEDRDVDAEGYDEGDVGKKRTVEEERVVEGCGIDHNAVLLTGVQCAEAACVVCSHMRHIIVPA
jgi:hypothetical protein